MFDNVALDVVIGLVFIYLLYSLLATIIEEIIATKLAFRAKVLEKGILRMLEDGKSSSWLRTFSLFTRKNVLKDKTIAAWFYAHPLIKYLGENNYHSKPSYLSAANFSKVMIDLLKGFGGQPGNEVQRLSDSIRHGTIYHLPIDLASDAGNPAIAALRAQLGGVIQNGKGDPYNTSEINTDTKLFLQSLWEEAGADIDLFRRKLEDWFDDTMDRATGWYKKHTQNVLLLIGLLMAICFNVDSIYIARTLMKDPGLREQMVQTANDYLEKSKGLSDQLKDTQLQHANPGVYDTIKSDYDALRAKQNQLINSAQQMINSDVSHINNILGLGGWTWENGYPRLHMYEDQRWYSMFAGWLLTALAISLGAPFWFDLLNKLMKLRGTGNKIGSSAETRGMQPVPDSAAVSVNLHTQAGEEAVG